MTAGDVGEYISLVTLVLVSADVRSGGELEGNVRSEVTLQVSVWLGVKVVNLGAQELSSVGRKMTNSRSSREH